MKIVSRTVGLSSLETALLVLPVTSQEVERAGKKGKRSGGRISGALAELEKVCGCDLAGRLRELGMHGKEGQSALLTFPGVGKIRAALVVGWPTKTESAFETGMKYRKLGSLIADTAKRARAKQVALHTATLDLKNDSALQALVEGTLLTGYSFRNYKEKKEDEFEGAEQLTLLSARPVSEKVIARGQLYAESTAYARDLINLSPRDCTPSYLMQQCKEIAKKSGLRVEVFDRKALEKLGAGALLAVAQGSEEPPYLVKLVYKPSKKSKRIISLVGKGVTFDSGGLSIKTGPGMESMKCDMSGAAAVMAAMRAIGQLKPAFEVRGYIPTTENMINGQATRPGDVVRASSGKTIEILNTDAEGRLILADAITMAEKDGCDVIVDLATLTGACMVALGTDYAGLFANDDRLAEKLTAAGDVSGEHLWRMPLAKEYKDWIKSSVADIKNLGKPFGGAITGALFLEEFVVKAKWAHLDIAGPAFVDGDAGFIRRGGVGFGVRTLLNYIQSV
ncbi:MAG: leucyl aminopeptidase [Oligoflexia bacterium]|nr:leucyl aminopeptidase [Oligoflexia bacterium]